MQMCNTFHIYLHCHVPSTSHTCIKIKNAMKYMITEQGVNIFARQ